MRSTYGDVVKIYDVYVPNSIKVEEAAAEGVSIFSHNPNVKAAYAYAKLAEEVIENDK